MVASVEIVPNQEVLTSGLGFSGDFFLKPLPQVPLFQQTPRISPYPILYENINPGMTITVTATGGCPVGTIPNLITGITLEPGQAKSGIKANTIVSLVDIAEDPVNDIPDFNMSSAWSEPRITYGKIVSPPVPTLSLVAPLKGYYGEKYWYDTEYIYASYYANTPEFTGDFYEIISKGITPKENRLTAISLLQGRRILKFSDLPADIDQIKAEYFPKRGIPLSLEDITPTTEDEVLTEGSDYLAKYIPEISSWVKWKPSYIKLMRYYYTLTVTFTCPPFVKVFEGSMLVENNWTPAANRLAYYIDKQVGFLDTPDGEFIGF